MVYSINKSITCSCDPLYDLESTYDVSVTFSEDFKDVLAYLFQKEYGVYYNDTTWLLEPNAKEFVKDLEDKWLRDEIDTYTLYHDDDFLEFMSKRVEVDDTTLMNELNNFKDDVELELRCWTKRELSDLIEDHGYKLIVEIVGENLYLQDFIDVGEIYDEVDDDEEDEE